MEKIKIGKCLCLLFVIVLMLFTTSMTTFLSYTNNGSTKVIAHIETAPTETNSESNTVVAQDNNSTSTGDVTYFYVSVSLLLLMISILVIIGTCLKKKFD